MYRWASLYPDCRHRRNGRPVYCQDNSRRQIARLAARRADPGGASKPLCRMRCPRRRRPNTASDASLPAACSIAASVSTTAPSSSAGAASETSSAAAGTSASPRRLRTSWVSAPTVPAKSGAGVSGCNKRPLHHKRRRRERAHRQGVVGAAELDIEKPRVLRHALRAPARDGAGEPGLVHDLHREVPRADGRSRCRPCNPGTSPPHPHSQACWAMAGAR